MDRILPRYPYILCLDLWESVSGIAFLANKISFTTRDHLHNPSRLFDHLRAQGDVVRVKLPIIGAVWITLSYEATTACLKDDTRFKTRKASSKVRNGDIAGAQWWMPNTVRLLAQNMLTSDGADHKRLRGLVDQAFHRGAVLQLESRIEALSHQLLDELEKDGKGDLVALYARQLPLWVICDLLGLKERDRAIFAELAADISGITGVLSFLKAIIPLRRMRKLLKNIIVTEQSRQSGEPGSTDGVDPEGLIAQLVQAEWQGERLSQDELIAMVFLLLMAGHETTTHAISTSVYMLLQDDEAKNTLFADAEQLNAGIEELLRLASPVQFSKPRFVAEAGPFYGAELMRNDLIMAGLAAANLDGEQFEAPNQLNLNRRPIPHVEFGTGVHFCLGHQLARLELKLALKTLFDRFETIEMVDSAPDWNLRLGLRGLRSLNIVVR